MKDIYFISVLGGLKIGSLIIIGLACLIIFIIVLSISGGDINDEMVKYKKPAIYMLAIGLFMNIIIPSKSDLFMIYLINEKCAINIDHVESIEYDKNNSKLTFNMINHNKIEFEGCLNNDLIDLVDRINMDMNGIGRRNNKKNTKG